MTWNQGLWACVYKGVEDRRVNGNVKSFLREREREEKSWNIKSNKINISLKILNKKCNKN